MLVCARQDGTVTHSGETWYRLRQWQGSQAEEERLAGQVLAADGYQSIDPSYPLGGPDTGKDALCKNDGQVCGDGRLLLQG